MGYDQSSVTSTPLVALKVGKAPCMGFPTVGGTDQTFHELKKQTDMTITQIMTNPYVIGSGVLILIMILSKPKDHRSKELTGNFDIVGNTLSRFNHGLSLGGVHKRISRNSSFMGSLVLAPSGAGKTTVSLISSVMQMMCSMIVLDPTGQISKTTSGFKASQGFKTIIIRFDQLLGTGYNLLKRADTVTAKYKLALALFGRNGPNDFWDNSGQTLLVLLFQIQDLMPETYRTIGHTIQLLNIMQSDPKQLDRFVSRNANEAVYSAYRSTIAQDSKVLANTISTVSAKLRCFNDPIVAGATSVDSIDLNELREGKVIIYIQCGLSKFYQPILAVLFDQIFDELLNRIPEKEENDIALVLEEFGSVYVPGFPEFLVNCRKNRVMVLAAIQSMFQLRSTYGNDQSRVITENMANIIAYGRLGEDLATMVAKRLGRFEFEDENGRKIQKNVKEIDELMHMEEGTAILLSGSKRPMFVEGLNPFYKNFRYRKYSELPPVNYQVQEPQEIPFLDFDKLNQKTTEGDV